jgi:glycosyltransferase involved in cell wall biosynthesis
MNFTFGIVTGGNNESMISVIIDSIKNQNITNYEIIIVGNCSITEGVVNIEFDENVKKSWITKKKNLITDNATYDNIVYLHDYIIFEDGWYNGQLKKGNDFKIRMDKILNNDGTRYRDWTMWPHNNNNIDNHIYRNNERLLPYNVTNLSKYQYISGAYWIGKNDVMKEFPLNEELSWGEGEDVEWSMRLRKKYDFDMNSNSSVRLLKNKDPIFDEVKPDTLKKILEEHDKISNI